MLFGVPGLKIYLIQSKIQVTKTPSTSNSENTEITFTTVCCTWRGTVKENKHCSMMYFFSWNIWATFAGYLVCTLFYLNALVRKRKCCQRKANCKQNNRSLGKSKAIRIAGLYPPSTPQRSAVQIHLFWSRYILHTDFRSNCDIHEKYIWQLSGTKSTFKPAL